MLRDVSSERGVLAAMIRGGYASYIEVADILSATSFTTEPAQVLYKVISSVYEKDTTRVIDMPTILSASEESGFAAFFSQKENIEYLRAAFSFPVDASNARKLARKVAKLGHFRSFKDTLSVSLAEMDGLTGTENIQEVLSKVEDRVLDFGKSTSEDDGPSLISTNAREYLEKCMLEGRPMGIPSGFPRWDKSHGGGFLPNSLDLVGARTKVGKSAFGLAVGKNVATLGYPVLWLDTEMTREEQLRRLAANMASVPEADIRDGRIRNSPKKIDDVRLAYKELEGLPIHHLGVADKSLDEIVAATRRWMLTKVGLNDDGRVKPSLVIYDYFKLTSSVDLGSGMGEYQAMGFMATKMKNLMARYDGRCLAFVQLNREGIDREDEAAIAQSDRLAWFCTSFSQLRWLSDTEAGALKKKGKYTHKLIPVLSRHGGKWRSGDSIFISSDMSRCQMAEGVTAFEESAGTTDSMDDVPF